MTDELKDKESVEDAELRKVAADAAAKQLRHRTDEYVAIILGVGSVLLLWFLQVVGVY